MSGNSPYMTLRSKGMRCNWLIPDLIMHGESVGSEAYTATNTKLCIYIELTLATGALRTHHH